MIRAHDDDAPVAEVDESLVAYLDGELSDGERQSLEDRLVGDATLRQRLSELQSGWEMLECLPPAHVTHDFARSTLEMVAASTSQELQIQRQRQPWRRLRHVLLITLATLLMAVAGFFLVRWLEGLRFNAQLADLPLAEHLDAYQANIDLELIKELAGDPQWNEAMQLAREAGGLVIPESLGLAEVKPAERARIVSRLDPEARRRLTGQWERLQLLGPERLAEVRQHAEAVRSQERPEVVLQTMQEYAKWFESLPPEKQERIVSATDKRSVILEEVERSALGWVQNYGLVLGESDRELIYEALKLIARDRLEWADQHDAWSDDRLRFLKDLRARWLRSASAAGSPHTAEQFVLGGMARSPLRNDRTEEAKTPEEAETPVEEPAESANASPEPTATNPYLILFGPPTAEEMAAIEEVISNKALLILNAASGSEAERQETLWRWCVAIIRSKSPSGNSPEVMLNRYLAMDPDDREVLDLKSPDEIFNELGDRRRARFGGSRP